MSEKMGCGAVLGWVVFVIICLGFLGQMGGALK